jgi:hypothetical protein
MFSYTNIVFTTPCCLKNLLGGSTKEWRRAGRAERIVAAIPADLIVYHGEAARSGEEWGGP